MPTDSLLISIGVCVIFLVFAFALAWSDHSTTEWLRSRAAERQTENKAGQIGQSIA
jgi:hypothetical protein